MALLLGVGLTLLWLRWEWKQIRRQQRLCWDVREVRRVNAEYLARKVAATIPRPGRVAAWVFPTPHGSEVGWRVRAYNEVEAAEILARSPIMKPEAGRHT